MFFFVVFLDNPSSEIGNAFLETLINMRFHFKAYCLLFQSPRLELKSSCYQELYAFCMNCFLLSEEKAAAKATMLIFHS